MPYLNYYLFHVIYCLGFHDAEAEYLETIYVSWLFILHIDKYGYHIWQLKVALNSIKTYLGT